jgi:glycosyltransferase involved in cell wall biosynthesis
MTVGVLSPKKSLLSIKIYVKHITACLESKGLRFTFFEENEVLPTDVDIYWDPRSSGGKAPKPVFRNAKKPIVVTVHGVGPFSIPLKEFFPTFKEQIKGYINKKRDYRNWMFFKNRIAAYISVSHYAKSEIVEHLGLDGTQITPIYHGKDEGVFKPLSKDISKEPYLLHISSYQPKKNVEAIAAAYNNVATPNKPVLKMVLPGYQKQLSGHGIELINKYQTPEEIAELLGNAMGFIFPSLHETFGLPILEAMASGCPVITANSTACVEVAGEAGILVNPRSVAEIEGAIKSLIENEALRSDLQAKGLKRAKDFTWEKSALAHLSVFKSAAS